MIFFFVIFFKEYTRFVVQISNNIFIILFELYTINRAYNRVQNRMF